jgi:hypothetical protein
MPALLGYTEYMTLEEQIINLTNKWCNYVSLDHHKDRDCHWYITKAYSYGEPAKYTAQHHGYIADRWTSQTVDNEEDAMLLLLNEITKAINDAIYMAKKDLEYAKSNPEDIFYTVEHYEKQLAALEA